MNRTDVIWSGALEVMRKNISPVSFKTWIEPANPVLIKNDELILAVENELGKNTLQNLYDRTITEAINLCSVTPLTIKYITHEEIPAYESDDEQGISAPMLNAKYTFDTFVVGESNRFAHAAALAVAENPAHSYNPLFIYGGVGLGKTHLIHAIGHAVYVRNQNAKIRYVTCEAFMNELVQALREKQNVEFRSKYRNIDILMIDDIQFIAGKAGTQDELFHTFNTLYTFNKQIILTSDKPPKEIPTLEARLSSRFECGLVADIQQPDFETRAAILRKKVDSDNMDVSDDVIYYIAENVESNIRELEGMLTRVIAHSRLTGSRINIEMARKVLVDVIQRRESGRRITIGVITQAVSDYYQISVEDILGKKRDKKIALARQICMYLCRKLIAASFEDIGSSIGGKHYTTVMHACEKVSEEVKANRDIRIAVEDIEYRLTNK